MTINNLSGESICIPFGASRRLSWQHLLGCLSWAERRLLMGWRRRKGRLGWYMTAIPLLHRVVCVVEKDVAPPDPCSGARLERVTYRIHNLNASVRVTNSVTSPALEGTKKICVGTHPHHFDGCDMRHASQKGEKANHPSLLLIITILTHFFSRPTQSSTCLVAV